MKTLEIEGKVFTHVKDRSYGLGSIYTDEDSFLRIGDKKLIQEELAFHKKIQGYNFPVAEILSEGEYDENQYYYREASFGEKLIADIFALDYQSQGYISDEHFEEMLRVVSDFAKAQYSTGIMKDGFSSFYLGMHGDFLLKEKPELKEKIEKVFSKINERLVALPTVLTHGDLNPHNMFPGGVIDFANSYEAPFGFDIVANITTTYFFPESKDFEFQRRSQFTQAQIQKYFDHFDELFLGWELPKLSSYLSEFIIARAVWACVRMEEWPKIRDWRYKKIEKMMDAYLLERDVMEFLLQE